MPADNYYLTTLEMAQFVAEGYLCFDAIVPTETNNRVLQELPALASIKNRALETQGIAGGVGIAPVSDDQMISDKQVALPNTGLHLSDCYPSESIGEFLRLPQVQGIIHSLVGIDPIFDHDWVHLLPGGSQFEQHLHMDAVIDTSVPAFDIQLFYFPHAVAPGGGGTRFLPGSHLRKIRAEGVSRYQHIVGDRQFSGPGGTVLVFHHGLWHAGQCNNGIDDRWMYKIRLNPRVPQVRLWNTEDLERVHNDFSDHQFAVVRTDSVGHIFRSMQPWQQGHESRYETIQRARLWRYLTGDSDYDVDYYLTRLGRRRELMAQ